MGKPFAKGINTSRFRSSRHPIFDLNFSYILRHQKSEISRSRNVITSFIVATYQPDCILYLPNFSPNRYFTKLSRLILPLPYPCRSESPNYLVPRHYPEFTDQQPSAPGLTQDLQSSRPPTRPPSRTSALQFQENPAVPREKGTVRITARLHLNTKSTFPGLLTSSSREREPFYLRSHLCGFQRIITQSSPRTRETTPSVFYHLPPKVKNRST